MRLLEILFPPGRWPPALAPERRHGSAPLAKAPGVCSSGNNAPKRQAHRKRMAASPDSQATARLCGPKRANFSSGRRASTETGQVDCVVPTVPRIEPLLVQGQAAAYFRRPRPAAAAPNRGSVRAIPHIRGPTFSHSLALA